MHTQEVDRRPVGYSAMPVTVVDPTGREIATFRSPRKLGKALVSGELVVLNGDVICVGKRVVVS
jgi:hypothetical protein